jgi:hypothetical protein
MSKRVNINSDIWGPKGWFFLDTIILGYPDKPTVDEKTAFMNFLASLKVVLPCEKCRIHFTEYIKKNPLNDIILSSKKKLVEWILECHNNVRRLQKKQTLTLDDFYNYYSKQINLDIDRVTSEVKEKSKINNILGGLTKTHLTYGIVIILLILIALLYMKF